MGKKKNLNSAAAAKRPGGGRQSARVERLEICGGGGLDGDELQ